MKHFRDMVILILSCSKRIATMDISRRRMFGSRIHSASSIDEITSTAIDFLNTSTIFNDRVQLQAIEDMIRKGRLQATSYKQTHRITSHPKASQAIPTSQATIGTTSHRKATRAVWPWRTTAGYAAWRWSAIPCRGTLTTTTPPR